MLLNLNIRSTAAKPKSYRTRLSLVYFGRNLQHLLVKLIEVIGLQNVVNPPVNRFEKLVVGWGAFHLGHPLPLLKTPLDLSDFIYVHKNLCFIFNLHVPIPFEYLIRRLLLSLCRGR